MGRHDHLGHLGERDLGPLRLISPLHRKRRGETLCEEKSPTVGRRVIEEFALKTKAAAGAVTAAALAAMGCDIVSGGGPGLMQAANEGAATASGRVQSVGIRVDLPFEQEVNAFVTQAFEHRTFFTRLHQFVLASDAFVVAPGGIGTVLETMMIWQLLQVRHLEDTPLILVGTMWPGLIEWARSSMLSFDPPLANPEDMTIPRCAASADEAIALTREHHGKWLYAQRAVGRSL